jgi:hypothetical protein
MKKIIFSAVLMVFVMTSCNQKNKEMETDNSKMMGNDSTMMDKDGTMTNKDTTMMGNSSKKMVTEKIYACPMHPEVQGKLNDKCSKCGMPLTEEVK